MRVAAPAPSHTKRLVNLPSQLRAAIEEALGSAISQATPVGGGCISRVLRVRPEQGSAVFIKWAFVQEHPPALLREEARSLRRIAATRTVRVPAVLHELDVGNAHCVILEWLEPGDRTAANEAALGRALAALHRVRAERYGWDSDNFIGSLPQSNRMRASWPEFWREERLLPQLELAHQQLTAAQRRRLHELALDSEYILGDVQSEGASLLHGDLWGGNVHHLRAGGAALIDPSSYYGHREVDLAMSALFGGFGREFYRAYEDAWPLMPGWEQRRLMYQLYYLLVHVNLFGGSYVAQTMSVVSRLGY